MSNVQGKQIMYLLEQIWKKYCIKNDGATLYLYNWNAGALAIGMQDIHIVKLRFTFSHSRSYERLPIWCEHEASQTLKLHYVDVGDKLSKDRILDDVFLSVPQFT